MPPSRLERAVASISTTLRRFPLSLSVAVVGVVAVVAEVPDDRWLIVAALALPVFIAATLWSERTDRSASLNAGLALLPLPLLVLYFLSLPPHGKTSVDGIRYTLLYSAAVLVMLASPFLPPRTTIAFHRFSIVFAMRTLATALFTLLLFGGLALALAAIEKLFGVDVDGHAYGKLLAVLTGFVGIPYLLAGLPRDHDVAQNDVPRGLRVLTQYVLLPILVVYALILYAHAIQQIVMWQWSEGWVARLVIGFASSGLLTLSILWPLRHDSDSTWIRMFTRWFAILLPPLAVLLFLAIMRRVGDYGITESRYYGLVLAVWLAGVAVYLLVSRRDDLRLAALSLAVIALTTAYGPWSAIRVSVASQIARLETILSRAGVLREGRLVVPPPPVDDADGSVHSIVSFLDQRNALDELRPWMPTAPDTIGQQAVMVALGLWNEVDVAKDGANGDGRRHVTVRGQELPVVSVTGYDVLAPFSTTTRSMSLSDSAWIMTYRDGNVLVYRSGHPLVSVDVRGRLQQIVSRSAAGGSNAGGDTAREFSVETPIVPPSEQLVMETADSATGCAVRVMIDEATVVVGVESLVVESVNGRILVRFARSSGRP